MLFESLYQHADRQPQAVAIHDDRGPTTYQQLAAMSAGMGLYIASRTERPAVGILLPAGAGYAASFYGTLLAGKSVVPINFLLSEREVAHVIADSGIDTVITIPPLAGRLKDTPLKIIDLTQLPTGPAAIKPKFPSPRADDTAVLMYTSGTSGVPKGVMLTYGNLQSDIDASIEHAALKSQHKFLGVIPLFHSFGMTASMLCPIQLGTTVVYMARFSPAGALAAIREHGISIIFAVPSIFAAIAHMKTAAADDFKRMYAMISGGEPLPRAVLETYRDRFGVTVYEGYGLTETSPVVALNVPRDNRPGSVGKPIPGVQVRITDDDGKVLGRNLDGELWLKGPMIFKGYYNLPDLTAETLTADGYFRTGDLARVDEDGYLHITGRKKDLIIVAGEKAAPREIEEIIMRHPAVSAAAVVGKKDAARGEIVVAFLTTHEGQTTTPEAIKDVCRENGLAQWKIPREVHIVPELPRSPTGKILKRVLAEQANKPA